ncbi:hypothetical protein [Sporichthya sp.]|uniref:hypothetical protein n=1 Tax=Sporichthya sp. TaxID=65475 RepID=UPI0017E69565|nr:hypothetical protein [Sporichthya sp.]MBA3744178.1 hypothetical protein [Sporichthya sp.]
MTSGEHEIWARLRAVEHESLASRQLAAAAYEEVGSLAAGVRANTSLLNALRETQVEQGVRLTRVETRLESLESAVSGLDAKVVGLESEVRTGFAMVGQGMATITAMVERITPRG